MEKRNLFAAGTCFLTLLVMMIPFLLSTPASAQQTQKPVVLKVSFNAPRTYVLTGIEGWCKEIEKRTNGQVKFNLYWAGALLKGPDALKGTGKGLADISNVVPPYNPADLRFTSVYEPGYVTDKVDAVARAMSQLYEESSLLKSEFERQNVKLMFISPLPPNIIATTKPVHRLEELKGKKIRAVGINNQVIAKLGGTPVDISIADLYESLSRKVVDGYTGAPLSGSWEMKLYEVSPHFLDFGYGAYGVFAIVFNKDKWNSLPADIRKTIEEVNSMGTDISLKVIAREEEPLIAKLKSAGCTFYTLPDDELTKWRDRIVPAFWNDWIERHKEYGPSKDFFNRYLELVKKYEASSKYINPFPK